MIAELRKSPSVSTWPEYSAADDSAATGRKEIEAVLTDSMTDDAEQSQVRTESGRENSSLKSFPGRALLRRLAGPKLSGGKRRGLLDSSSDSDN
jgi:hypothetical protein